MTKIITYKYDECGYKSTEYIDFIEYGLDTHYCFDCYNHCYICKTKYPTRELTKLVSGNLICRYCFQQRLEFVDELKQMGEL